MPGTKKVSKRAFRKAKKAIGNKKKAMAKKNMDTFFLRIRNTSTLTPTQGVSTPNYIYQFYTPSTATGISDFAKNADFQLYQKLYDRFRINRMNVKMIPKANVLDFVQGQNNGINQIGDMVIHTAQDRDGIAPSSIGSLTRYASYKQYSALKVFNRSYKVTYPKGMWLDCQNISASGDRLQDQGLYGGITIYGESFPEALGDVFNDPVYSVEVTYDIVFCGRTSAKLGAVRDLLGNVIGVEVVGPELLVNLPQSPITNIRGHLVTSTRTQTGNTEVIIGAND